MRRYGAIDVLISDRAEVEISDKVHDVLQHLCIQDWQPEPHQQNKNAAEQRYKDVQFYTQGVMNLSGAPPSTWLLCMEYVCFIMNQMALGSLNSRLKLLNSLCEIIGRWSDVYIVIFPDDGMTHGMKSQVLNICLSNRSHKWADRPMLVDH